LISIKKYLESGALAHPPNDKDPNGSDAAVTSYRSLLLAIGKGALQGFPAVGAELDRSLQRLEVELDSNCTPQSLEKTQKQAELHIKEWGGRTAEHVKARTDEVKELLIALAKTAESVGNQDQRFATQFKSLTGHLEAIADLDDFTQIRSALVYRVSELKNTVDQMTCESQKLVTSLRNEVTTYETRLKAVEHLVLKDELTGAASRHSIEEQIQWNIANSQTFCVLMLDLNEFKKVNDRYGHLAGDDMLKQFATELRSSVRPCDVVGRWGGDEFVTLLQCNLNGARASVERIREWVFGKYTIECGEGKAPVTVLMDASMGVAEWHPGQSMQQLIAEADHDMYRDKKNLRSQAPRSL